MLRPYCCPPKSHAFAAGRRPWWPAAGAALAWRSSAPAALRSKATRRHSPTPSPASRRWCRAISCPRAGQAGAGRPPTGAGALGTPLLTSLFHGPTAGTTCLHHCAARASDRRTTAFSVVLQGTTRSTASRTTRCPAERVRSASHRRDLHQKVPVLEATEINWPKDSPPAKPMPKQAAGAAPPTRRRHCRYPPLESAAAERRLRRPSNAWPGQPAFFDCRADMTAYLPPPRHCRAGASRMGRC